MSGGVVSGRESLARALHGIACSKHAVLDDCEDANGYREDADALLASGAVREEAAVRAEAWDEGYQAFAQQFASPLRDDGTRAAASNPYRAALAPQDPA